MSFKLVVHHWVHGDEALFPDAHIVYEGEGGKAEA